MGDLTKVYNDNGVKFSLTPFTGYKYRCILDVVATINGKRRSSNNFNVYTNVEPEVLVKRMEVNFNYVKLLGVRTPEDDLADEAILNDLL